MQKFAEQKPTYQKSEKSSLPTVNTTKEIAKAACVSHDTIAKVEKIEAQATPEIKAALKSGDMFHKVKCVSERFRKSRR